MQLCTGDSRMSCMSNALPQTIAEGRFYGLFQSSLLFAALLQLRRFQRVFQ